MIHAMRATTTCARRSAAVLPLLLGLGLTTMGTAQTQWSVGPGGYAQIRDVMDLVGPGDTVVVAPGTYHPFRCVDGITLRAATPGTVTVAFSLLSLPPSCGCTCLSFQGPAEFAVPAGQTAHVVGVSFAGYYSMTPCLSALEQRLVVSSGRVTFDTCTIDRLIVQNAAAHLQDCTLVSAYLGPGLLANGADVTVLGGSIAGNQAGSFSTVSASPGLLSINSRVHASGVVITGGAASATLAGAPGIQANGGSLWLSDATVTAGGGCAVNAGGTVRIDRSTLNGSGTGCAVSPTGAPLLGIDRAGPIVTGQVFQVTVASEPGALVLVYGSTRLGAPLLPPVVEQPVWIDPTTLFLADVALAAASGQTTFAYPVPGVAALVGAQFWLQGVGGTSFPLQTSPTVGGIVR